jgi:hypothetical protein
MQRFILDVEKDFERCSGNIPKSSNRLELRHIQGEYALMEFMPDGKGGEIINARESFTKDELKVLYYLLTINVK